MRLPRSSGVLLHLTSLPSPFGIGDLGPSAYRFVDWLKEAKQSYWQMLPIGLTGDDGSPYSGLSAMSGNPLLISPELLLTKEELMRYPKENHPVDFIHAKKLKREIHLNAFKKLKNKNFSEGETLATYLALSDVYGPLWQQWPNDLKWRNEQALLSFKKEHADKIAFYQFEQSLFFTQWRDLKNYANKNGIKLIGDIPIFSASNSADIWEHPEWYFLDEHGYPFIVSGAPPDSFSATGQKWGNPLYRWDRMKESGYSWWCERIKFMTTLFDIVRIDHFRGFESYWEIPAHENDARKGHWVKGPDHDLFNTFKHMMGDLPLIAEDLGFITEEVHRLRADFNLPTMRILQFAFESDHHHPYLPQHIPEHSVVYTGTHDNNTSNGWLKSATPHERYMLSHYVKVYDRFHIEMIKMALFSRANTAIIPLQDILGKDEHSRMNAPGLTNGNWRYQFSWSEINPRTTLELAQLTSDSGRAS